ncbi:DUF6221 family protein [Streptomyces sp. SR-10]|uniref:DUF6221 family protein n=1 Tax=Streptomyces sp. SR-10 TaxID=3416442 RepID=UPI003CF1DDC7
MTDALVAFLKARLYDDEHWALTVSLESRPETWEPNHENGAVLTVAGEQVATGTRHSINDLEHIARQDPARTLREVEAKRQLLDAALTDRHHVSADQYETCPRATAADGLDENSVAALDALNDERRQENGLEPECWGSCGRDARTRRTLELLALPYSDHPGYEGALTGG